MRGKILAGLGAALLLGGFGTVPAQAHAFLVKSDPAVGSTVKPAPKTLLLSFTEDLEVPFCSVTVVDGMGMNDTAGKPRGVPGHADEIAVPLNIAMPGKILVTWHAVSVDTHKTQGSFYFTVSG